MLLASVPHANIVWLDDLDSTAAFAERLMKAWLAADEEPLAETLLVAERQDLPDALQVVELDQHAADIEGHTGNGAAHVRGV